MYADSFYYGVFIRHVRRLAACGWLQLGCGQFAAHQPDRALLLRNGGRRIAYIAAVMVLFPLKITQFFVPDGDSGLLTLAAAAVPIFAVAYLARWVSLATESYMTAVGKYLQASVISVVTAFAAPR